MQSVYLLGYCETVEEAGSFCGIAYGRLVEGAPVLYSVRGHVDHTEMFMEI